MVKSTAATQERPSMTLANLGRTGAIGGASRLARAMPTSSMATAAAKRRSPHLPYASRRASQRAGMSSARYAAARYAKGRIQSKARSTSMVTSRTIVPLKKRTICERALRRSTRRVARRVARELPSRLLEGRTDKHNNTARLTLTRGACYTALPFLEGRVAGKEQNERPEGVGEGIASSYRKAGPYIDASWQLAGAVGLGTLAGWWLDKKLSTGPWLLVSGALLGIGIGFYLFFKILMNLSKRPK